MGFLAPPIQWRKAVNGFGRRIGTPRESSEFWVELVGFWEEGIIVC